MIPVLESASIVRAPACAPSADNFSLSAGPRRNADVALPLNSGLALWSSARFAPRDGR